MVSYTEVFPKQLTDNVGPRINDSLFRFTQQYWER